MISCMHELMSMHALMPNSIEFSSLVSLALALAVLLADKGDVKSDAKSDGGEAADGDDKADAAAGELIH